MKKISISSLILLGLFSSCIKNAKQLNTSLDGAITIEKIYDSESNLKRAFGKSLMESMKQSPMLRNLIKAEALKMFDKDFEVLYYSIKNDKLENGISVDEMIAKNLAGDVRLTDILDRFPTLTILIPELPEHSFSAKLWNADKDIPAVAIRTDKYNDVPMIKTDGKEEVIAAKYTPGFPIIVVCENERVIANTKNADFNSYKTKIVYKDNGLELRFWADGFDNTDGGTIVSRGTNALDQKVIDAYNIYKTADGWQRDYIYYGIKPTVPNGAFSYEFKEHLRSFQVGDATNGIASFNYLADQAGDPPGTGTASSLSSWSQGSFEFKVKTKINGKNGTGDELTNGFSVSPTNLFTLTYTQSGSNYLISSATPKEVLVDLPLFNWRLEDYSAAVKVGIEEVDLPITTVSSESRTSKYAINFGLDAGVNIGIVKLGLKFGVSGETTETKTAQTTITQSSDDLYEAIVNFADKVVIKDNPAFIGNGKPSMLPRYETYQYSTGKCTFSIEPKKVQ